MKKLFWIVTTIGIAFNLITILFFVRPTAFRQIILLLLFFILICLLVLSIILAIKKYRYIGRQAIYPVGMAIVLLLCMNLAFMAGERVRLFMFNIHFDRYQAAAQWATQSIKLQDEKIHMEYLPREFDDLAEVVLVDKEADGTVILEFIRGSGVPVKHTGYVYISKGELDNYDIYKRWYHSCKFIRDHWYDVCD